MSYLVQRQVVASDSSGEPWSFLNSESHCLKKLLNLCLDILVFENKAGLLANRVDLLTNHFDELELKTVRDQNDIILSGPFFNVLAVLGEEIDIVDGVSVNVECLGLVHMANGAHHANL